MKKVCLVLVLSCSTVAAVSNETYPIGARAAALGNASVALHDVWSAAQNQAGLGFIRQITTGVHYENRFLLKELSIRGAVLALPLKAGTVGLSLTNCGYSLCQENKYGLSFAKAFSNSFSIGLAVNYLHTGIAEGNGNFSAFTGEIGLLAKPRKSLLVGAHLSNPTRARLGKNTAERIPTQLRLGINYSFSKAVLVLVETEKDLSKKALFKAGIEYQPLPYFYLRSGISSHPVLSTFGIGFYIQHFQIDLSASYHQTLGISPQFGLTYLFNKNEKIVRDGE